MTTVQPWPQGDSNTYPEYGRDHLYGMARQQLRKHHHLMADRDPLTRANCSACVLAGYVAPDDDENNPNYGPNYAGWARVYVEGQEPIPAKWRAAFRHELESDNEAYAACLARSVATFGVTFTDGRGVEG